MARVFQHIEVSFTRVVHQEQMVDVAVPPEIAGDEDLCSAYVAKIAPARLKDSAWKDIDAEPPVMGAAEEA